MNDLDQIDAHIDASNALSARMEAHTALSVLLERIDASIVRAKYLADRNHFLAEGCHSAADAMHYRKLWRGFEAAADRLRMAARRAA